MKVNEVCAIITSELQITFDEDPHKDCKWWTKGMCLKWLISTDSDFYCAKAERENDNV